VLRTIFAFNGDLESRLALHWLVHEQGHEVISLSINLGQDAPLHLLAETALDLGAVAAQVVDGQDKFLRQFALPVLQANAVYQNCYLGSALARYVIAEELVQLAWEEGCTIVAHGAASKGNDQVRMETAIAALAPEMEVIAPVRRWPLRTWEDKLNYAKRHDIPVEKPAVRAFTVDRNLWGTSIYGHELADTWSEPPDDLYVLTRLAEKAPDEPALVTIGFEEGVPCTLNDQPQQLVPLVKELNRLAGEHGVGRNDVVEDRLFGIKSREFYEAPAASLLLLAHRHLAALVQSKELRQLTEFLARRYADLVYSGLWFHEARRALDGFVQQTQQHLTGEVRLKLFKGLASVQGRRSPFSLYNNQLANQSNLDLFDSRWAEGFTSLWTLSSRVAARQQKM
jgi:argininosuccinate synthase